VEIRERPALSYVPPFHTALGRSRAERSGPVSSPPTEAKEKPTTLSPNHDTELSARLGLLKMALTDCKFVWKNGKMVPWNEASIHISCHGLHYGTGVFEGVRCYETPSGPALFRLGTHMDRWFASARAYSIAWPYSRQDLAHAVLEVVRANQFSNCYIRPIAFFGSHTLAVNPMGCPTEVVILAWPCTGTDLAVTGIDACVSPWRKFSTYAFPARVKACGPYVNFVLATQDATRRGFSEALLLDDAGNVTEGPSENLFLVKRDRLFTNDPASGIRSRALSNTLI
jgi:branched-chain amino acid aminotransferase